MELAAVAQRWLLVDRILKLPDDVWDRSGAAEARRYAKQIISATDVRAPSDESVKYMEADAPVQPSW
jgi:hypothetical protein